MLVAYIADHTQLLYNVPPTPVLATCGSVEIDHHVSDNHVRRVLPERR